MVLQPIDVIDALDGVVELAKATGDLHLYDSTVVEINENGLQVSFHFFPLAAANDSQLG